MQISLRRILTVKHNRDLVHTTFPARHCLVAKHPADPGRSCLLHGSGQGTGLASQPKRCANAEKGRSLTFGVEVEVDAAVVVELVQVVELVPRRRLGRLLVVVALRLNVVGLLHVVVVVCDFLYLL